MSGLGAQVGRVDREVFQLFLAPNESKHFQQHGLIRPEDLVPAQVEIPERCCVRVVEDLADLCCEDRRIDQTVKV